MKRIVVKIGTKTLSTEDGRLDINFLRRIVAQIVQLRQKKQEVVIVTSGAVGAGRSLVKKHGIESSIVQKQVFAAVGQVKLMGTYSELFGAHDYMCAQVLATKEDFRDEEHYLNMQKCFEGLLLDNVVPIVNENDVVATTELLFTDNDELAGLVAVQLKADCLIILTTTNGVLNSENETVKEVSSSNAATVEQYITPDKTTSGRGGMMSKFNVAQQLSSKGIDVYILNGREENVLLSLDNGTYSGTRFAPQLTPRA